MKQLKLILLCVIACFLAMTAMAETDIKERLNEDGSYQIILNSNEVTAVEEAQTVVKQRADVLCGDQFVVLGKYTFSKTEPLNAVDNQEPVNFELIQDITCEDKEVQVRTSQNNSESRFEPPQALIKQAETAFDKYRDFLNKKNYKAAYEMLSETNQQISSYKSWRKDK